MILKKLFVFGLMAAVLPAFAEEAADRKTATSLKYVEHELDTRQNKFTAEQNKAMEYTNTAGDVEKRAVTSNLGTSTTDTSLPMVGGVNTKLATKQDDIAPINDHTAVTYTGTAGTIGAKGIYQATESYADQSDNLIDAKTFNAALKKGLDSEFLCSEYKPGTDLCWVWSIHNNVSTNLFDKTDGEYIRAYVHATTGVITEGTEQYSFVVPCQPNTTYSLSGMIGGNSHWGSFTDKSIGTVATVKRTGNGTITTGANDKYLIGLAYTSNGTYDYRNTLNIEKSTPYTTLVPAGYTPVEWIESSGTQYIDTGIVAEDTDEIEVVGMAAATGSQFFFSQGTAANNASFQVANTDATGIVFDIQNWALYRINSNVNAYNSTKNIHIINKTLYIDGVNYGTSMGSLVNPTNTMRLFISSSDVKYKTQIQKFSIKGKINLIPARRNRDSVLGMYDTVSGEFFENDGDGVFQAGPDVNNIIYVPQNQ